ncbi:ABC transporter substrate-binding protein [Acrocarpospora pleiomorpha]|uniref:ABC transporter substrate-binding protein n=1 Tax=Acrocarpospora pleiomorpha TaxID=90975 RepID=A0A5M3XW88_9ACTN|nr:substrate-binding domain-containing protein [Acrocarpospora pleiomorpha]GES23623.1 ABC transporter substrate-binding protein [Acrocarpospora pleiomorpha]
MSRTYLPGRRAAVAALLAVTAGCTSPDAAPQPDAPVKFGLISTTSGPLAAYGQQYLQGFEAGLQYATKGTGKVGDRMIEVTQVDDGGDPAKAVAAAKDLAGKGVKIIGGSTSSATALQVATVAAQNKILNLSGPAAADAITGVNRYTFRTGRQTFQDIASAQSYLSAASGKNVVVFAQDNTFGQGNLAAVKAVMGASGATVGSVLVPEATTEFTPFAIKAKETKPDLLFVAWAGTTATAMWQSLQQQDVLSATTVVTGLDAPQTWPAFGPAGAEISFVAHWVDGAADNPAATALKAAQGNTPGGVFGPDGFNLALMLVRAIEQGGGDDPEKMIASLEGWSFDSVAGNLTVRAADHALLQPAFQVKLTGTAEAYTAQILKTLSAQECAPPVTAMKG